VTSNVVTVNPTTIASLVPIRSRVNSFCNICYNIYTFVSQIVSSLQGFSLTRQCVLSPYGRCFIVMNCLSSFLNPSIPYRLWEEYGEIENCRMW